MTSKRQHWNTIFSSTERTRLGWYEEDAVQTLGLLDTIPDRAASTIFIPGAGTSILIDQLLAKGAKLILNDISSEALNQTKARLQDSAHKITWLCQDIALPIIEPLPTINIWIDRAVLHFLTTENDIGGYFDNVRSQLKVGGYALFAEFSKKGARKCAGLEVHRYSVDELTQRLGTSFELVSQIEHNYVNPEGGNRPYIYALFKRFK